MASFRIKHKDDKAVVSITGEITIHGIIKLKEDILVVIKDYHKIAFDLSAVSEIDSSGFQFLVSVKRSVINSNKVLKLINHSVAVLKIFSIYGAVGIFKDKIIIPQSDEINFEYGVSQQSFTGKEE